MKRFRNIIHLVLIIFLTGSAVGCVEGSEDLGDLTNRSFEEELLAEDIEALLPGTWRFQASQQNSRAPLGGKDLDIIVLGHDAVTGDVAILIEGPLDGDLQPGRIVLDESVAILRLPEVDNRLRIERIEDDVLILQDDDERTTLLYHRER
jgi:hypothetical protein